MLLSASEQKEIERSLALLTVHRGDEAAWAALYKILWPRLFASAFRDLRGVRPAAEDVAQSVFVRLCLDDAFPAKIASGEHLLKFSLLHVRHACIDVWRSESRGIRVDIGEALTTPGGISDSFDGRLDHLVEASEHSVSEGVGDAIRRLSATDRQLLELIVADAPRERIADELGQSLGAIRVRLHRIRQALRKSMENNDLDSNGNVVSQPSLSAPVTNPVG